MKILRLLILASVIFGLASCSTSSTADTSSTIIAATTTVAAPDCSQAALDAVVGEKAYVLGCSSNWSALQPNSWECGEHCFAFIYKWEQAKWNLTMRCSQYDPLSAEGWCQGITGQISDGNYTDSVLEFPPNDVVCKIWANSLYEDLDKTNCA